MPRRSQITQGDGLDPHSFVAFFMTQISIIVPVYRGEKFLRPCLDSLIGQTFRDIEIILVDDAGGGGDTSFEIMAEYAAKDSRIKIIRHDENRGISAARNTGIEHSSSPYVMFCDQDDLYKPQMCEKMHHAIESSGAGIAICEIALDEKTRNHSMNQKRYHGLHIIDEAILWESRHTRLYLWNKIYRRNILSSHNISFPVGMFCEDTYFFHIYCFWIDTAFFIPEELYVYRVHSGSTTGQMSSGAINLSMEHFKAGIAFHDYLKRHGIYDTRRNYMERFFMLALKVALLYAPEKEAIYDLALSFMRKENVFPEDAQRSPLLQREVALLKNRALTGKNTSLFHGLIKIQEDHKKKNIYFLGIPVLRVTYGRKEIKWRLFGFLRIWKKQVIA